MYRYINFKIGFVILEEVEREDRKVKVIDSKIIEVLIGVVIIVDRWVRS